MYCHCQFSAQQFCHGQCSREQFSHIGNFPSGNLPRANVDMSRAGATGTSNDDTVLEVLQ